LCPIALPSPCLTSTLSDWPESFINTGPSWGWQPIKSNTATMTSIRVNPLVPVAFIIGFFVFGTRASTPPLFINPFTRACRKQKLRAGVGFYKQVPPNGVCCTVTDVSEHSHYLLESAPGA